MLDVGFVPLQIDNLEFTLEPEEIKQVGNAVQPAHVHIMLGLSACVQRCGAACERQLS